MRAGGSVKVGPSPHAIGNASATRQRRPDRPTYATNGHENALKATCSNARIAPAQMKRSEEGLAKAGLRRLGLAEVARLRQRGVRPSQ